MANRVKPKRVFGGVTKRKESALLHSIREAEKQAAEVIAQPMAHEALDAPEVEDALRHPVPVKVSDPTAVPLEEIEARRSRHTYQSPEDRRDGELRRKYLTKPPDTDKIGFPYVAPHADALEYAAHYLASVVCASNNHKQGGTWPPEFPCKLCFSWAIDRLHDLGSHRFPIQEKGHDRTNKGKKSSEKVQRAASRSPTRKSSGT